MPTLTKPVIDALAPNSALPDTGKGSVRGLYIRKQRRDPVWVLRFTLRGRAAQLTLGMPAKGMTIDLARKAAIDAWAKINSGEDPRRISAASKTFGEVVEEYLASNPVRSPRTLIETTRQLRKNWTHLAAVPLAEVTRASIAETVKSLATKQPHNASRARSAASALFRYAISMGYVTDNPVLGSWRVEKHTLPNGGRRKRVLTPDELRRVWHAADPATKFGAIVRLLMLTACRRDEIGSMQWNELRGDTLLLPDLPGRIKGGKGRPVPLSPAALALIPPPRGRSPFVFSIRGHGYANWSGAKSDLDAAAGVSDWRLHDLRRTAASLMRRQLRIAPHLISEALGHKLGADHGVADVTMAHYIGDARDEQGVRDALTAWSEWVLALVSDADVKAA